MPVVLCVSPFQERKPSRACAGNPSVSLFLLPSVESSFTSAVVLPAAFAAGLHDPLLWGRLQLHPGQQLCPLLLPHAALHQRAPADLGQPVLTLNTLGWCFFLPCCSSINQAVSFTSQNVYLDRISAFLYGKQNFFYRFFFLNCKRHTLYFDAIDTLFYRGSALKFARCLDIEFLDAETTSQ